MISPSLLPPPARDHEPPADWWIAYSDLMAGLLLGFMLLIAVVILIYRGEIETQKAELDEQIVHLKQTRSELDVKNAKLKELDGIQQEAIRKLRELTDEQNKSLDALRQKDQTLAEKDQALQQLDETKREAIRRLNELVNNQTEMLTKLHDQEARLAELELTQTEMVGRLESKEKEIQRILGVKRRLVESLVQKFKDSGLSLQVDPETGAIQFAEGILFGYDQWQLTDEGKEQLKRFVPAYVEALFGDKDLKPYVSQVIIEGHTDNKGSWMYNLELSQKRAFEVAQFIQGSDMADFPHREGLRDRLTANGRSYSQPVLGTDGQIDLDRSRRVEFKFLLKEMEKIDEMRTILQR